MAEILFCIVKNHDKKTLPGTLHPAVREYLNTIAAKGGATISTAKADASRANGIKGGRPRKTTKQPTLTAQADELRARTEGHT